MAGIKIGDIVEIKTSEGLAYAQYTHKHKQYGGLIRVFLGLHQVRPSSFDEIVSRNTQFFCFFPLSAAVNKGIVSVVGSTNIPNDALKFPIFRDGVADPKTGKVAVWWLWDGENEWRVGDLSPEQRKLSIRGVWNDTLLIERIQSGWTPETDSE